MRRGLLRKIRGHEAGQRRPASSSPAQWGRERRLDGAHQRAEAPTLPAPGAGMSSFAQRLASGQVIVADGGMGAVLGSAVPGLRCPEEANLRAPEAVVDLHLGYIRAGAEL